MKTILPGGSYFIGDCRGVISKKYYAIWSIDHSRKNCNIKFNDRRVAISNTSGRISYYDQYGYEYKNTDNNIALVPMELCTIESEQLEEIGQVFTTDYDITFRMRNGIFVIRSDDFYTRINTEHDEHKMDVCLDLQDKLKGNNDMDDVADLILNNSIIVTGMGYEYYIKEIEFYIHSKHHPDPFTYMSPEQKQFCSWYFHKTNKGNFRNGTFKGLDLTLGDENTHYGILIRSIEASDHQIIEGPCRIVDKMIEDGKYSKISEFVEHEKIYLDVTLDRGSKLLHASRVGLTLKKPGEGKLEYIVKKYRYCTERYIPMKERNKFTLIG
jgi:hypothetical protein